MHSYVISNPIRLSCDIAPDLVPYSWFEVGINIKIRDWILASESHCAPTVAWCLAIFIFGFYSYLFIPSGEYTTLILATYFIYFDVAPRKQTHPAHYKRSRCGFKSPLYYDVYLFCRWINPRKKQRKVRSFVISLHQMIWCLDHDHTRYRVLCTQWYRKRWFRSVNQGKCHLM